MIKNHMKLYSLCICINVIFIFMYTMAISVNSAAQDSDDIAEPDATKKIGQIYFTSIDGWADVPVFYANPGFKNRGSWDYDEIIVWEDGRIAWRDERCKSGLMFCKSHISCESIVNLIEKLSSMQKNNEFCSNKVFYAMTLTSAVPSRGYVLSEHFFKEDSWSTMLGPYINNRANFQTTEKVELLDLINRIDDEHNYFNCNPCRFSGSLRNVQSRNDASRRLKGNSPFSDDEKYNYALRYRAEAEFFCCFMELLQNLIPDDSSITPEACKTFITKVVVYKNKDAHKPCNEKETYTYVNVTTPRLTDTSKTDERTAKPETQMNGDSGKILELDGGIEK